jgi:hypothetical protein
MSKNKEKELAHEIDEYVDMFNSVCKQIGNHLLSKFPKNRNIHIYNDVVCDIIKKKPAEPISIFVINIWANDEYKESIMESNEHFFMDNDHEELTGSDKDSSDILSQVKSCWGDLNEESKFFIKEAFKTLINLCDAYVEKKDDLNKLKKQVKLQK